MAKDVFANGMEISCKAGDNKVISAFPDVCLSPPSPPAGPIPIPYPLFSSSGDTTSGSKNVKINSKEVMLKDKSYYKKSKGDEAATKSFGQGTVSHTLGGKVYFISWSMDVEVEGENVVRHLDMTTSNHASPIPNGPTPIPGTEGMDLEKSKCWDTYVKYDIHRHGSKDCGSGKESHHIVQNACFETERGVPNYTTPNYNTLDAPCICLKDGRRGEPHYRVNRAQEDWAKGLKKRPTYSQLRKETKQHLQDKVGMSKDEAECLLKIVDKYMETIGVKKDTKDKIGTILRKPG